MGCPWGWAVRGDGLSVGMGCPCGWVVRGWAVTGHGLSVGMVGSRQCTLYGRQQAERLAGALARAGFTIVSGLARGIDEAAHRGALLAGGRTLAVCATGLANIYPPEHVELAKEVCRHGAVISEMPPTFAPIGGSFPQQTSSCDSRSTSWLLTESSDSAAARISIRTAEC